MPVDARNRFDDDVFTYRITKDGKVLISYEGRLVTTLAGKNAHRLIARLDGCDRRDVQQLLARATGNFKRGNER